MSLHVVLMDDKINSVVRVLSGGMKRKLSLGIALIGNNKVVCISKTLALFCIHILKKIGIP
ncbi:hypothetical protein Ahy_B04g069989 isoform E [Arachis hypogaea]|uniref:Uncharacterized protein n=1 Tax=Arachis hypogaea TaxID=3818 RepID=A0A444ZE46_ARAHY|nr:hypothetical protein Ahy_B04g069989 isoform E [Arachis hypogaea]